MVSETRAESDPLVNTFSLQYNLVHDDSQQEPAGLLFTVCHNCELRLKLNFKKISMVSKTFG